MNQNSNRKLKSVFTIALNYLLVILTLGIPCLTLPTDCDVPRGTTPNNQFVRLVKRMSTGPLEGIEAFTKPLLYEAKHTDRYKKDLSPEELAYDLRKTSKKDKSQVVTEDETGWVWNPEWQQPPSYLRHTYPPSRNPNFMSDRHTLHHWGPKLPKIEHNPDGYHSIQEVKSEHEDYKPSWLSPEHRKEFNEWLDEKFKYKIKKEVIRNTYDNTGEPKNVKIQIYMNSNDKPWRYKPTQHYFEKWWYEKKYQLDTQPHWYGPTLLWIGKQSKVTKRGIKWFFRRIFWFFHHIYEPIP